MKVRKILIVYKRSVFEKNFQNSPFLKRRNVPVIGAHLKRIVRAHDEHYASLKKICDVLKNRRIPFALAGRKDRINFRPYDLVVTVGGDGTFMEISHQLRDKAVLGVNSATHFSIGRYCYSDADHFPEALDGVLTGRLKPVLLQRLRVDLNGRIVLDCILNDFLVAHTNPSIMSRYVLQVGRRREEQRSSGLWISTPSGSTGAIKSAGGQVIASTGEKKIVYVPRELYQGLNRKYFLGGGILKSGQSLRITSMMKDGMVYGDGGLDSAAFPYGAVAQIGFSAYPLETFQKV